MKDIRGNRISIIFQDPMTSLNPTYTIGKQLMEAILLHTGRNKSEAYDRAVEMLKLVNVNEPEKRMKQYPYEFSGGMKAKIKVITALSYDSKVLILDEPTVGLDVVVREEVLDLIREYVGKNEERSVIISSHISSDIEKLCDDIYMIHDGKIVFHDDTDKLLFEYAAIKVDEEGFANLDKKYIKTYRKEKYGYECLTWQRDYYLENYPSIVVEKMSIDEMMMILIKGEKI